jgi:hypothetical protein
MRIAMSATEPTMEADVDSHLGVGGNRPGARLPLRAGTPDEPIIFEGGEERLYEQVSLSF